MRFIYHIVPRRDFHLGGDRAFAPPSLEKEGFIHTSYRPVVLETARLYYSRFADDELIVLQIDPRKLAALNVELREEMTPRGGFPHVFAALPSAAICGERGLGDFEAGGDAPDQVTEV